MCSSHQQASPQQPLPGETSEPSTTGDHAHNSCNCAATSSCSFIQRVVSCPSPGHPFQPAAPHQPAHTMHLLPLDAYTLPPPLQCSVFLPSVEADVKCWASEGAPRLSASIIAQGGLVRMACMLEVAPVLAAAADVAAQLAPDPGALPPAVTPSRGLTQPAARAPNGGQAERSASNAAAPATAAAAVKRRLHSPRQQQQGGAMAGTAAAPGLDKENHVPDEVYPHGAGQSASPAAAVGTPSRLGAMPLGGGSPARSVIGVGSPWRAAPALLACSSSPIAGLTPVKDRAASSRMR